MRTFVPHRAPELIGLPGRKAGRLDRQTHPLFLEERHAHRALEHRFEFGMRIGDRLQPRAPAQERMDHLPLDRPGPDDRDLHHDVVEARRLEARQHRLLRA